MVCIRFSSPLPHKPIVSHLLRLVNCIHNQLLAGCVLGYMLAATPAIAEYQPPSEQKSPSGYTQSAGPSINCTCPTQAYWANYINPSHLCLVCPRLKTYNPRVYALQTQPDGRCGTRL
jgi:hypothetical protein